MSPADVNNAARAVMGGVHRFWERINATLNSTGSANAYVLTYTVPPASYVTGESYAFIANFANTGGATANVNSLGAKSILHADGTALLTGDIPSGAIVWLTYNGTAFQLMGFNPVINLSGDATGSGTASVTVTLANSGVTAATYSNLVIDVKGRVTSARAINSTDVTTGLGYTPVNKAGDVMTGSLARSNNNAVTAAGTTQGGATSVSSDYIVVTAGSGGIIFPAGVTGIEVTVINRLGTALNVYPATSCQVDALGNNVAYSLPTLKTQKFYAASATQWYAMNFPPTYN